MLKVLAGNAVRYEREQLTAGGERRDYVMNYFPRYGEEEQEERSWYVGTNPGVAVSSLPARLARQLREGGQVRLRFQEPGAGGRRLRHDLDLPASAGAIDRTLEVCDRPAEDTRDNLLDALSANGQPAELQWAQPPRPRYPSGRTFDRGFVTLSCISQPDGRVGDCVVESEFPAGGGFAQAALDGALRGRLENRADPASPIPARLIVYTTNFTMEGGAEISTGSRLRRP